jgi:hypothetical protein
MPARSRTEPSRNANSRIADPALERDDHIVATNKGRLGERAHMLMRVPTFAPVPKRPGREESRSKVRQIIQHGSEIGGAYDANMNSLTNYAIKNRHLQIVMLRCCQIDVCEEHVRAEGPLRSLFDIAGGASKLRTET